MSAATTPDTPAAAAAGPSGAGDPVARAEALLGGGEPLRAIEVLTEANRARCDAAVEEALVRTRNEAFALVEHAPRAQAWPPPLADPFPDVVDDVVWITPDRLDLATVGGTVLHHGCVAVRGLVDRDRAERLAAATDEVFLAREALLEGAAPESVADRYLPFEPSKGAGALRALREWVRDAGAVWAADAPHLLFEVLEDLGRVGLIDLVEAYLGERPALSVNKSVLRKVTPTAYPSWHQDGAFLGDEVRALNVWVALTPCGGPDGDAPAIEMVPRRMEGLVETGTEGAYLSKEVGQGVVDRVAGDAPVLRPAFEPGDALVFDDVFLHRTAVDEGMTRDRFAIEWWCFAPSGFPPGYVPLVV